MEDLRRIGSACGLEPITFDEKPSVFWQSFSKLSNVVASDEDTARLASLYCAFAFKKRNAMSVLTPLRCQSPGDAPVAVYTGSFDPFHRNHAALCKHVLQCRVFSHVFLVPN